MRDQEQETAMYDQQPLFDDGFSEPVTQRVMREEMQASNAKVARSLRDIGRETAEAELRAMHVPIMNETTVRLRATVTTTGNKWCEVTLGLSLHPEEWWQLGGPFLVARMGDQTAQSRSLYAISLLKRLLGGEGVQVELDNGRLHLGGADVEEWSWWARLSSPLSVAVQVQTDGSVRVVGLR
jgi:hypothetical protein